MARKRDKHPKNGREVRGIAARKNIIVREGKGSHFVMRKKNGQTQTCPSGTLSPGLKKIMVVFLFGVLIYIMYLV